jgi:hypothetical protein
MKNLLVAFVVLTVFFGAFILVATQTKVLYGTPFYWVAKDIASLFTGVFGGIGDSVFNAAYPVLEKLHFIKDGKFGLSNIR